MLWHTTLNAIVSVEAGVARSLTFPDDISASNVASTALPVWISPNSVIFAVVPL
jgi:hypothetical protein